MHGELWLQLSTNGKASICTWESVASLLSQLENLSLLQSSCPWSVYSSQQPL